MELTFQEVSAKRILNVHKHVDGPWFWTKYAAHPYVGCRSGCAFCYARGHLDPETFDTQIRVKTNAVGLLRDQLSNCKRDVISAGDWQRPAEDRYRLSRGMLAVVRDLAFPLFIVERSPLLTRDLDLLVEIDRQAWVGVAWSISSLDAALKRAFEPRSPGVRRRLRAMETLAQAGLLVGTALMPVLPFVGDDEGHLADVVRATKDHGGRFVLGGGLTMQGEQARCSMEAFRRLDPAATSRVRALYDWAPGGKPRYSPPRAYSARLGMRVRELCDRHGLLDRIPRYIAPGPLAVNRRIAERLFLHTYDLELEQAPAYRVWAYRKAAWTVDEWPESVAEIHQTRDEAGLQALPNIGKSIAKRIARWLRAEIEEGHGQIHRDRRTTGAL
jgi:DNA repair photolyase